MKDKILSYLEVELLSLNDTKRYYEKMAEREANRDVRQYYSTLSDITQAKIDITKKHIKDIKYM